jgi:hypothetical protein
LTKKYLHSFANEILAFKHPIFHPKQISISKNRVSIPTFRDKEEDYLKLLSEILT